MKNALKAKLQLALETHPWMASTITGLKDHRGLSLAECEKEGFSKRDLLNLERLGLCVRGRTYNGQLEFHKFEGKTRVRRNFLAGSQLRYIFIKEDLCLSGVSDVRSVRNDSVSEGNRELTPKEDTGS